MSSDTITLKLSEREVKGKAVKSLRRQGLVPANIYERGKESMAVSAPFIEITKVYNQAGKHHPVELVLEGKKHLAMIKDVDLDPVKNTVRHIAFHAVKRNEKVDAEVPVRLEGEEIPAEKMGYMILTPNDIVEVEALPANLPDELVADLTVLAEIGDKITVADLKVPEGVTITSEPELVLAIVEETKDQIAEADAEAAESAEASEVESDHGTDETQPETASEEDK